MRITGFTLVNAETRQNIRALVNNDILYLGDLPTNKLNIRANTNPDIVGRVEFAWGDGSRQIERHPPYAAMAKRVVPANEPGFLGPDNVNRNYVEWTPVPGDYRLIATPFPTADGGIAGQAVERTFAVSPGKASDLITPEEISGLFGTHPDIVFRTLLEAPIPQRVEVKVRRDDVMKNRVVLAKKS